MNHKPLLAEYKDALATQRWEVVAPLIHEEACFIFSEGTYFGKAAIEATVNTMLLKMSFGPMSTTTAPPAHRGLSGLN
jgi:hypothetical protein